jgi:hypothetical protein
MFAVLKRSGNLEFILADELKKKFKVRSHFYNMIIGENSFQCRNYLEISANRNTCKAAEPADAVVIMMNPGSSRPDEEGYEISSYKAAGMIGDNWEGKDVNTRPDNAQYQIMRLMLKMNWEFVRVLNLSDFRCGSSKEFQKLYEQFSFGSGEIPHSIFHPQRETELRKYLKLNPGAPVILAWGSESFLLPIAKQALSFLENFPTVGVNNGLPEFCYRYPSPYIKEAKLLWLKCIAGEIKELSKKTPLKLSK